jgi:hypothetical protein
MRRLLLLLAALPAFSSGCTLTGRQWMNSMTPSTANYDDGTDDAVDPWIAAAAEEGRRTHTQEKVNDPLGLRPYFMSEKARSIEANVGIVE